MCFTSARIASPTNPAVIHLARCFGGGCQLELRRGKAMLQFLHRNTDMKVLAPSLPDDVCMNELVLMNISRPRYKNKMAAQDYSSNYRILLNRSRLE